MQLALDHVAVLSSDLELALAALGPLGAERGPVESFPGEGTREVYLGGGERSARLLLMQPLGSDGPYARALAKRGPGLHHLAFVAPQLDEALAGLGRLGWLVHPASLASMKESATIWLARPGVSTLLELSAGEAFQAPALVEGVAVPVTAGLERLVSTLPSVRPALDGVTRLEVGGQRHAVSSLLGLVED